MHFKYINLLSFSYLFLYYIVLNFLTLHNQIYLPKTGDKAYCFLLPNQYNIQQGGQILKQFASEMRLTPALLGKEQCWTLEVTLSPLIMMPLSLFNKVPLIRCPCLCLIKLNKEGCPTSLPLCLTMFSTKV